MSSERKKIEVPLLDKTLESLKSGDRVLLTGTIYTARDAAHKRLFELIQQKKELPFDIVGQVIYYVGPSPAKPGQIIGSAGPTTSYRMDVYSPALIALGLKGMIGKGARSREVRDAMLKYKAVYFAAVGGAAALIAKSIKKYEIIDYHELGAEALGKMFVLDFPAIVVNDIYGSDLYEEGVGKFREI